MLTSGTKTSEFWVMIITALVALLNSRFGFDLSGEEMTTVFGLPAAYVVSRGLSKLGK